MKKRPTVVNVLFDARGEDIFNRQLAQAQVIGVPPYLNGGVNVESATAHHSQMFPGTKLIWQGDYGWRAPKDFPGQTKTGTDSMK
jgi:hypothetical protein